jgi:hypothetical protein
MLKFEPQKQTAESLATCFATLVHLLWGALPSLLGKHVQLVLNGVLPHNILRLTLTIC